VPEWSRPVYHLYVVQIADRDGLQARLSQAGIGTGIHYPIPLHLQTAYSDRQFARGSFPASERLAPRILSLPMFPNLTSEDQRRVGAEVLQLAATSV
jgi:dTDP-4-amino-4,6-dideoxygalactose transaminase